MIYIGHKPLVLFLPVLTRWTSHYLAIRCLIHLKPFLVACVALNYDALVKCAGARQAARTRAVNILGYVRNEVFWAELEKYAFLNFMPINIWFGFLTP